MSVFITKQHILYVCKYYYYDLVKQMNGPLKLEVHLANYFKPISELF